MKNPTTFTYDILGRKTRTDYPDGTKTTASYSINSSKFMTVSTDQNEKSTMTLRESDGQIVEMTDTGGNTTKYTYDAMKQIRTVEDAKGNKTKVTYDSQGRRTIIDNPDAGLVQFYYNPAGNMTKKITPNLRTSGKMIKYIYDYNRLAQIDYPDSNDVYYTYGDSGIGSYRAGRLIKADNGAMSEEFFYGKLGETTKTIRKIRRTVPTVSEASYTTMYKWDNFGRMTSMTYPDGEITRYFYDRGGLLKSVTGQMGVTLENYAKKIEYDEFGQRTKFVYGNDVESVYTYDARNRRLMNLKTTKGGTTFQNLNYEYDNVGNILTKENKQFSTVDTDKRSVKHIYTYDDLYRLTGANGQYEREGLILNTTLHNYTNALEYDTIGNITTKNQTHNAYNIETKKIEAVPGTTYNFAYTYGAKPHAVLSTGSRKYIYDDNGNMTNVTDTGFNRAIAWDEENRIKSNTDNGITTEYKYDSKGERIIKKGSYGEVVYVNNNYAVRNGTIFTKNVFAGNTRICSKVANGTTQQGTYYYHADHLGSSNLITDKQASFKEHLEYFPYGEMWVEERSNSALDIRYAFTGKEYDPETGLYYHGARYRDPKTGGWLSVDPFCYKYLPSGDSKKDSQLPGMGGVFNPVNLNLYHYAANNPLKYIDPDGTDNYVFYDKKDFSKQAEVEATRLKSLNDETTHLIDITTAKQFEKEWGKMENATNVSLLFHGSEKTINIDWKSGQYLTTLPSGKTHKSGANALFIGNLEKKEIGTLNIMSCHGGDVDVPNNVARTFMENNSIGSVIAKDGSQNYWPLFYNNREEAGPKGNTEVHYYKFNNAIKYMRKNSEGNFNR